ncbi:MAG: hypothetical protein LUE27_08970 [Clostridia bacterium]|nr:hypothetical protein [Clostridia bacterium]
MSISKEIRELTATASVKEKARIYFQEYVDGVNDGSGPSITREEADAIYYSVRGTEARREFEGYSEIYETYASLVHVFGLACTMYTKYALITLSLICMAKDYIQEQNHLNIIYQGLKDTEGAGAAERYKDLVMSLSFVNADPSFTEDGYIRIDYSPLWESVLSSIENMKLYYDQFKSFIVALEAWTRKHRGTNFMPRVMKNMMKDGKRDFCVDNGIPEYSRKELQNRIKRGERVTEEERARAVIPSYEEIETTPANVKFFSEKIKSAYKTAQGR